MTMILCAAASALFMAALACAFLPFIAVWDRRLAVLRRRSLYDKSAGQVESISAGLNLLVAAAFSADLLAGGFIDRIMAGPWRFLWEALVMASAFAALCAVIVLFARRGLRSAFGLLTGFAATASSCLICVLMWAFTVGALHASAAGAEDAAKSFILVLSDVRSMDFLFFVLFSVALAASAAYGLALCWHILLRSRDDFGRDFYTFTLSMRSRQASYAGLMLIMVAAVQYSLYPQMDGEWASALLPGVGGYAEAVLTCGLLCLPAAFALWHSMSRAALPMQKRSFAFMAMLLLAVGVYCALGRIS
ncbi:hypothetical protein [Mailhella sp.]|uniref:hypothetical protein n=1 Tax=Mailhella sp. TaxID=1981029 RepID=UPI0040648CB6